MKLNLAKCAFFIGERYDFFIGNKGIKPNLKKI